MSIVGVASVKVTPDLTGFRKDLTAQLKAMKAEITVDVQANVEKARATIDKFVAQESKKTIDQKVKVDQASLKEASSAIDGIAKAAQRLGVATVAFTAITSAAQALGPALVAAAGSALLLPGALLSAAAIIGTVKLGADGIKKAFDGLKPTLTTLKAQVSATFQGALVPAVNNLKRVLPQLSGGFREVASAVSQVLNSVTAMLAQSFKTLQLNAILSETATIVTNVGKAFAPIVSALLNIGAVGLPVIAGLTQGIGAAAQKFNEWTASAEGAKTIQTIILNSVAAFKFLGQVLTQVAGIVAAVFSNLSKGAGDLGSSLLPVLTAINAALSSGPGAAALQALGAAMAALGKAIAGSIGPAIQAALPALTTFFNFVAQHASTIGPLVAGFAVLGPVVSKLVGFIGPLVPILQTLFTLIKGNPIILLVAGIVALLSASGQLKPILDLIGNTLKQLGDAILPPLSAVFNALVDAIRPIVQALLPALQSIIQAVMPLIKTWANLLGKVLVADIKLLAAVLTPIAKIIAIAIQAIATAISAVIDWFSHLGSTASSVGGFLSGVFSSIGNFFSSIGSAIGNAASAVGNFFSNIGSTISNGFNAVVNFFKTLPGKIGSFLASLPGIVGNFLLQSMKAGLNAVVQGIEWIIAAMLALPVKLVQWGKQLALFLVQAFVTAWNAVTTWLSNAFTAVVSFFQQLPGRIVTAITNFGTMLVGWALTAWAQLTAWVSNAFTSLVDFFKSLPDRIITAIQNFGIQLVTWAVTAWTNARNAIVDAIGNIVTFVTGLPQKILNAIQSLLSSLRNFFVNAWNGAVNAISTGISNAVNFVKQLPGKILSALGNLGSLLVSAGEDLVRGLWNGIQNLAGWIAGKVKSFVSGIVDKFTNLLGIGSPSKVMRDQVGHWIPAGIAKGIEGNANSALDAATTLSDQITGAFTSGLGADSLNGRVAASVSGSVSALAELGPTPVVVQVSGDEKGLRSFIDVQVDESNRVTKRNVTKGVRR